MNKKALLILPAIALIAAGCGKTTTTINTSTGNPTPTPILTPTPFASPTISGVPVVTPTLAAQTVNITVTGKDFSFSPSTIRVKKGDHVRITFKNEGGSHDWVLDEFNASTKVIQGGKSEVVEFVADRTGTFEYYCSVGNHRQMGMKGSFIVE
jgi:plastocyanin